MMSQRLENAIENVTSGASRAIIVTPCARSDNFHNTDNLFTSALGKIGQLTMRSPIFCMDNDPHTAVPNSCCCSARRAPTLLTSQSIGPKFTTRLGLTPIAKGSSKICPISFAPVCTAVPVELRARKPAGSKRICTLRRAPCCKSWGHRRAATVSCTGGGGGYVFANGIGIEADGGVISATFLRGHAGSLCRLMVEITCSTSWWNLFVTASTIRRFSARRIPWPFHQ